MKKLIFSISLFLGLSFGIMAQNSLQSGEYHLFIQGFDWGPHAHKVVIKPKSDADFKSTDFKVIAHRSSDLGPIAAEVSKGERNVLRAYESDYNANPNSKGQFITLILGVAPYDYMGSAIQYFPQSGNKWITYTLEITNEQSGEKWGTEKDRTIPVLDDFDLSGKFTFEKTTLSYASFKPKTENEKSPLLIWLHGGGEGGTDPSIAAIGNKAINYADEEIQSIMEGAYVLVPQAPTFWMNSVEGGYTTGQTNDIYNDALMELIEDYVDSNPGIDKNRVYVGGCSNGGYMSLKLILKRPDYFAAGYISALAYYSEFLTDEQIASIKNVPIWFVQSKDDRVTDPSKTVVPVYERLKKAGAPNVHFSFYDHVVDITNQYGGEDYHYDGHWSWIYLHANECRLDYYGKPVKVNGLPVNIMQWLSLQTK
ncbi:prolyl oligopeptidase family serine peptidase [Jiulongibacter sp. NS-SX5]|uniref:prolyl oligopeptidase family serine peptidase n=1 Tax=Jiulongibacter sp. NS-SX5 TaxID=3463854 RepID=UPI004058238B